MKAPPRLKGLPLLGVGLQVRKDPLGFLTQLAGQDPGIIRGDLAWERTYFLTRPEFYQHVLRDPKKYSKQTRSYRFLRILLGDGLLTSEGEFWLRQRRTMQPAFHRERIQGFADQMTQAAGDLLRDWEAREGAVVDLTREMMELTYRIVSQALFSTPVRGGANRIGEALKVVLEDIKDRSDNFIRPPLWVPTPKNLRARKALHSIQETALQIIAEHRNHGGESPDLLTMLLNAKDPETGEGMSDTQLVDEVVTILMAGHETTASALTWTFILLSQNPEVEVRLAGEVAQVLGGRPPGLNDLPNLPLTERVIKEAMRLYPPVWWLDRMVLEDDEIGGYRVPKNSFVVPSPFLIHHHPGIWQDPERFDPDRFLPEKTAELHPYAYIPFSLGPRQCIGNLFAMMEARLILASVLQRYRVELLPGQAVTWVPSVIMRPKGRIQVSLHPR